MSYHLIDPADLEQWDDRPVDVRSISVAAGLDHKDAPLGLRVYKAAPGEQLPLTYHSHDEQVEAFYVLEGPLHVETPEGEYVVETDQVLVIEPDSPQRAYNPATAEGSIRVLAIGAPSADDARPYDPSEET